MRQVLSLALVALLCSGCAASPSADQGAEAQGAETRVRVDNRESQDARIYALVEGARTLIGTVPASDRRGYFDFAWAREDSLAFAVAFTDGRRCTTEARMVPPESSPFLLIGVRRSEGRDGVWRECRFEERVR